MKIISIFEYFDYKKYVLDWLEQQPNKGRGFYTLVAEKLGTSNAAVSQIFKGERDLNLEQATEFSEILGLAESEYYYFILLVEYGKAGSVKLKKKLKEKINFEQNEQKKLINRVAKDVVLSDEVKSIYYSSWVYTGLRNLIAVEAVDTVDKLASRLKIEKNTVQKIIQFLLENKLLISNNSKLVVGPQKTHLDGASPWVARHHHNWRIKSMDSMQNHNEQNLFYTGPMSMSVEVAEKVRAQLPEFIKQVIEQVGPSKSEVVRCLNIDWFEY